MMSTVEVTFRVGRYINNYNIIVSGFHQSCVQHLNQRWRAKRGLTANPNSYGPLTNLPDYTFKSGKPVPLGVRQKIRLDKQREYAGKIIKLVREIDFAVERHAKMQEEEDQRRQQILDSKLKPKGDLLLQKQVEEIQK